MRTPTDRSRSIKSVGKATSSACCPYDARVTDLAADHRTASQGFLEVAGWVADWSVPTPCTEWDARAVVEHIIGYHEALVLAVTGRDVERPRDDPPRRWAVTAEAVQEVLADDDARNREVDVPGMGRVSIGGLAPTLTTDVLVHTWDLARAIDREVTLDPDLCAAALERARGFADRLAASGMFAPPVEVPDDAPVQDLLLGLMGRDPAWRPAG